MPVASRTTPKWRPPSFQDAKTSITCGSRPSTASWKSRPQDSRVGDRLVLVPGYSDFTNVLHDEFYVFRGGKLEGIWPLAGRGKIR